MKVAVTGGSGFIGSNLIHRLLHGAGADAGCCPGIQSRIPGPTQGPQGLEILNLDCLTYAALPGNLDGVSQDPRYSFANVDVADHDRVRDAFRGFEPDLVFHLAAESHVDRSIADGAPFVRSNVQGTQSVLDAVRRCDVPGLVCVSTDEVYGSIPAGQRAKEDAPLRPSSPYAASKAAADLLALAHRRTYGTSLAITRCTNNWGPRQHPEKLVPKALARIRAGQPVPIYGSGTQRRDWIHVWDHCAALEKVAAAKAWGEAFNVAGGCELSNLELVAALGGRPDFVADRPGHDERYAVDDAKLRALGWTPRMPPIAAGSTASARS